MDTLHFITAGNVDDGKSTLIGRLLYDSKNILIDQLVSIEKASKTKKGGDIDLSLLTDGLRAEREQGITIDVAYKYFSTAKRKFIIADTPGHVQYTRNMITGASNADLIIILVDARKGVTEQTRRHSIIASLLNIEQVIVAINKIDLVEYDEKTFNLIAHEYQELANSLGLKAVTYIPISALKGDNIVKLSQQTIWYKGNTLLEQLENAELQKDLNPDAARFSVQYVIRPQTEELHDYRGYAGKIISGVYKKGDAITVLPSGISSKIKAVQISGTEVEQAFANQSVVLLLTDNIDVSRGDAIVKSDQLPELQQEFDVTIAWMDNKLLLPGNRYLLQFNSSVKPCVVKELKYKLDVNTLEKNYNPANVALNEIVQATIKTQSPVAFDHYKKIKANGAAILIDETSHATAGAVLL